MEIKYLVKQGVDDCIGGMRKGAKEGNKEIIDYFIEKGGYYFDAHDYGIALHNVIISNKKKILEYLLRKDLIDLEWMMAESVLNNNKRLVDYFIHRGAHLNICIPLVAPQLHEYIIDYMFMKMQINLNNEDLLNDAIKYNHVDLVKYIIIKNMFNEYEQKIKYVLRTSVVNNSIELVKYLIEEENANNFDEAMTYAAQNNHKDMVNYFIAKGASNFDDGLVQATESDHKTMVDYMVILGATDFARAIMSVQNIGNYDMVNYLKFLKKKYEKNKK